MTIFSGYYIKEYSFESTTLRNIFASFNSVFNSLEGLYILTSEGFELMSGDIFLLTEYGWMKTSTGEMFDVPSGQIIDLNSVLIEDDYDTVLTENDYNDIL